MRAAIPVTLCVMLIGGVCMKPPSVEGATSDVSLTITPARFVTVDGDVQKFQAHHWMTDGFAGGIENFSGVITLDNGLVLTTEGYAFVDQNDFDVVMSLTKDDFGFITFDFQEFRKYYDNNGGVYHLFPTLSANDLGRDLALDIGHFAIEGGLRVEGWPELTLLYEREYKDGTKSRLTWAQVDDGGIERKIAPVAQDIDEIVDLFALQANHEVGEVQLNAEQTFEFVSTELFRQEAQLATTGVESDTKVREQIQAPEAKLATTTVGASRWFMDERAFASLAYRFAHMNNQEWETLQEFDAAGNHEVFSFGKNYIDARADNDLDTHTWVGSTFFNPWDDFSIGAKVKAEMVRKESNSTYPLDNTPGTPGTPNGIIDRTEHSLTENKANQWGEGLSLRYTGIPRSSVYGELEFEQGRVLIRETRISEAGESGASAGETFYRETVTNVRRGSGTIGIHSAPCQYIDLTGQVRHRRNNHDYDDQQDTTNAFTSAFVDEQDVTTDEVATRITLKPNPNLRTSFRYQYRDDGFFTRVENLSGEKASTTSHIYTVDVTAQPRVDLLTTVSFSRQTVTTETPARLSATATTPSFHGDVNTWLFAMDFAPTNSVSVHGAAQYSMANNFDDFTSFGLPLGVDNNRLDLSAKVNVEVADDTTVGAEYAYFQYDANDNAEFGDYNAHVVWLEVTKQLN